jgi:hypothetical protein
VQYVKKNSKQQMSFNLFAVTNVKKKHYQDSIEELMSAYHVNKGDTMATIKQAVEDALLELLDEGKIVIKGPDGEEMEDLTVEMKVVEDDNLYDSEDSSSDDEDLEDEDDK